MANNGIDSVTFGVTNQTKAAKYLDDWGLKTVRSGKYGADCTCADGTEVSFRDHKSKSLAKANQTGSTICEVI